MNFLFFATKSMADTITSWPSQWCLQTAHWFPSIILKVNKSVVLINISIFKTVILNFLRNIIIDFLFVIIFLVSTSDIATFKISQLSYPMPNPFTWVPRIGANIAMSASFLLNFCQISNGKISRFFINLTPSPIYICRSYGPASFNNLIKLLLQSLIIFHKHNRVLLYPKSTLSFQIWWVLGQSISHIKTLNPCFPLRIRMIWTCKQYHQTNTLELSVFWPLRSIGLGTSSY